MLIHDKMDLTALAEEMGFAADRVDALLMRETLMARGLDGQDTLLLFPLIWRDALDKVAAQRFTVRRGRVVGYDDKEGVS